MTGALWLICAARGADLSGTVTAEDGTPLAAVEVVVYDARLNYATAVTAADGSFTIGSIPPGPYRARAVPDDDVAFVDRFHPDVWDFCASEVISLADDAPVGGVDFLLPEGGRVTGRILDLGGAAVEGAAVVAIGASDRTALVSRVAYTDADGRFAVVGLDSDPSEAEPYTVYVQTEGFPRQYLGPAYRDEDATIFALGIGEAADVGDHALLDGIVLSGTVYGDGAPVASGTVYAYSSSQVADVAIEADGTWIAEGLPPGDVLYWASSTGFATTYSPGQDRPVAERLSVPDEGQEVVDADLDLAEESTLALVFTGDGDLGEVSVLLYNSDRTVGRGGALADDGRFTITGLYDGDYTLVISGAGGGFVDGYLLDEAGAVATIRVEGDTTYTYALAHGASVEGQVTDDDGRPVYGAYVYAYPAVGDGSYSTVTDADGRYALDGMTAADLTIKATYSHFCPADAGWVTMWWDGARVEESAASLAIAAGGARTGVDLVLPRDDDHDAMGDAWEREHGLDATRDDADEDADGDGYANLAEWLVDSDPTGGGGGLLGDCGCGGCGEGGGEAILLLPLLARARRYSRRTQQADTGAPRS